MNHDITNEVLTEFSTAFSSNPVNHIAMNAVTSAGLLAASKNPMAQRESVTPTLFLLSRVKLQTRSKAAAVGCLQHLTRFALR